MVYLGSQTANIVDNAPYNPIDTNNEENKAYTLKARL